MMNSPTIYVNPTSAHEDGFMKDAVLFPVHAENEQMALSWVTEMNQCIAQTAIGNYSLSHFDEEFGVFWIKTPANLHITAIPRIGYGCYDMVLKMKSEGKTDWQFPYLWPNGKTTEELAQPPQELFEALYLIFNNWQEFDDLQLLLDKLNERFCKVPEYGQWQMFDSHELVLKHSVAWGDYINAEVVIPLPCSLGMLFEIGVHLSHAFTVNLWEHPPYIDTPLTYRDNLNGVKEALAEWQALPDAAFRKKEEIVFFEKKIQKYSVTEPIQKKITALQNLRQSRPLLAREQLQLEILQSILDAQDEATINAILAKIAQTPTDAELRKILSTQAEAKRDLIIDNNS